MSKKLAICIPHYRRKEHLDEFIPHMEDFMKKYHSDIEFKIFVANQIEPDTVLRFNRGTAKNIAFNILVVQFFLLKNNLKISMDILMIIGIGVWKMMIYCGDVNKKIM